MEGFSVQELAVIHDACIYKANVLIDERLYEIRVNCCITDNKSMDEKWLNNTANDLQEIADCMKMAAKMVELGSKEC